MIAASPRAVHAAIPSTLPSPLRAWLWGGLAVTAAAIAYYPIVGHSFFADDFYNLYRIRNDPLLEYILKPQGGHLLVTTYTIFYLSNLVFGPNPEPYFAGVLALHLLNTILLFALIRRVTSSDLAACAGAALWGVCPTHEGSLGWYSVFGHVLLGTSVLLLLYDVAGVERHGPPGWARRAWWAMLVLIGATSFGIGLAVGLVFPLLAWLMLPPLRARRAIVVLFAVLALFMPVLYVFLSRLFQGPQIGLEIPYEIAVNSVVEKFGMLLVTMTAYMAANGVATTLVSTLRPAVHFPSLIDAEAAVAVFAIGCAVTLAVGSERTRRYLLAALVLMCASYAMIVFGRIKFYPVDPNVLDASRYHYVASLAIALSVALMLAEAGRRVRVSSAWTGALLCLWLAVLVAARLRNGDPPDMTRNAGREAAAVVRSIREAIEAEPGDAVYIPANDFHGMGPFFKSHALFPGWAGIFVIFFSENVVEGRRVYFLEPNLRAVRVAAAGRRSAGLLVLNAPGPGDNQGKKP